MEMSKNKNQLISTITKNFKLVASGFIVFTFFNWEILSDWYFYYFHIKYFLIYDKVLETATILILSFIFYMFFLLIFIIAINIIINIFKVFY